jgi:hypothetical protein
MMWRRAHAPEPTKDIHPLNLGWIDNRDGHYEPYWFAGTSLPDTLMGNADSKPGLVLQDESNAASDTEIDPHDVDEGNESDDPDIVDVDDDIQSDDQPWSDDSESDWEEEDE